MNSNRKNIGTETQRFLLPYPTELRKSVGETKFSGKVKYCPGIYPVKTTPLPVDTFGIIRANRKQHNRTNHR